MIYKGMAVAGIRDTTWKIVAVVSLLGIATGCEPQTQITSNRATDYVGDPRHLVIVSDVSADFGAESNAAFAAMLVSNAKQCGVEAVVVAPLAWPANTSSVAFPSSLKPDSILLIGHGPGLSDSMTRIYDLQLRDFASKRLVWRANATFQGGTGLTSRNQRAETLATELTTRMRTDGLFRSCAV
jgi:hypothetical protein